jgi:hypothetical protein
VGGVLSLFSLNLKKKDKTPTHLPSGPTQRCPHAQPAWTRLALTKGVKLPQVAAVAFRLASPDWVQRGGVHVRLTRTGGQDCHV